MKYESARIRIPIFLQFAIMYLLISSFVILSVYPIFDKATDISRTSYLSDAQLMLDKSGETLMNTFKRMYLLPLEMDNFEYYVKLKSYRGDSLSQEHYGKLHVAHRCWLTQTAAVDYACELFLFLTNNVAVLGKQRVFGDIGEYLDFDLVYTEYSPEEIEAWLRSCAIKPRILPATPVGVRGSAPRDCLTFGLSRTGDSAVIGAVLDSAAIRELFLGTRLPKDTAYEIVDGDGNLLMGGGEAEGEFAAISTRLSMPDCTVTLRIPESFFEEQLRPVKSMSIRLLFVAAAIGLALSVLFAVVNSMPIKRLARREAAKGFYINEYREIGEYIHSSSDAIRALERSVTQMENGLRDSLFLRLLFGVSVPGQEDTERRLLPQLDGVCRVALLQAEPTGEDGERAEYLGYLAYEAFRSKLPDDCVSGQISGLKAAVLLPGDDAAAPRIAGIVEEMNEKFGPQGLSFAVAASEAFEGRERVYAAYQHAQMALSGSVKEGIAYYSAEPEPKRPAFDYRAAQRLYALLVSRDAEGVRALFEDARIALSAEDASYDRDAPQLYHVVRFVLRAALEDNGGEAAPDTGLGGPERYNPSDSASELCGRLLNASAAVIRELNRRREGATAEVRAGLIGYIDAHYESADLYAANLAERFRISENAVYRMAREATGMSLSEYIEQKRMARAMELISTTAVPIGEIALLCGYNNANTFYKAFRKRYGGSPGSFRISGAPKQ